MHTFFALAAVSGVLGADPLLEQVTHGYTDSDGVRIHHASLGPLGDSDAPLLVMLHGFPDYWYTWRAQMPELARDHLVVAIDLRGYNRSDKPVGVEQYDMTLLMADVAAVIRDFDRERAIVCGHDWGGAIAWNFAMWYPQMTERLMICNLPHPNGISRELRTNRTQQANSNYATEFQAPGAHEHLTAEGLAGWVEDPDTRAVYVEAFERSDFEAMLNYYKRNYPKVPDSTEVPTPTMPPTAPRVKCSVLVIHGLEDPYLLAAGLNDTWEWIDGDLTIVTIPDAGHFVQQDASELVTRTMRSWLDR